MAVWMVTNHNSLHGIFDEIKVEGQPVLWYLIVKAVQQIYPSPSGIALANLFFIGLAVLLLLKYAPFTRLESVLLCFSYFILYEYGTISRNYAMSVLFIFAVCALYQKREKNSILIAILLAMSCSIHAMNIIFASCFAFLFAAEKVFHVRSNVGSRVKNAHLLIGALILIVGILLALGQATPPEDSPWSLSSAQKWRFYSPLAALKTIWLSFVPVAFPTVHFWNTNILPNSPLMTLLSFIILVISCLFFIRKPLICLFYTLGVVSFLFFFYRFYHGFTRHHGYLFLLFLVSYWISHDFPNVKRKNMPYCLNKKFPNKRFNFFTLVCFLQSGAVFIPLYFDWKYPFSSSRDVGQYLLKNNLQDCVLLGDVDFSVAPVAGWVDREMYYPAIDDYAKMVIWNHANRKRIVMKDIPNDKLYHQAIWQTALRLAREKKKDVILILNYRIEEEPLKEFPISIVADETYFLYRVQFP